ncbi:MAG: hypothetical protein ACK4UN_08945 [Limisphaerales bacterium]
MIAHAHPPLRVLVQNCRTEQFLKFPAAWTNSPAEAYNFQTTSTALEFCREGNVEDVRTILQIGDALLEIAGGQVTYKP